MRVSSIVFFILLFSVSAFGESFIFPLAESDSLKEYSTKLSKRRNKFKIYRRVDVFRGSDEVMKKIIQQRPHSKVIESLGSANPPQVTTIPVAKEEVSPFYSNFYLEKRFTYHLFNQSFKERFGQRLDQFRHQENGASQIGSL